MALSSIDGLETLQQALDTMGASSAGRYDLLLRDNRVLCALPTDSDTAMRTLELYQPQRWNGRILKWCVQQCLKRGRRFPFLKSWLSTGDKPHEEETNIGIMVGSTGHHCERAVAVVKSEDHWEVVKLAFGPDSAKILDREAVMLKKLWAYPSVPEIRDYQTSGNSARLHMTWQDGVAWHSHDISQIIGLLKCWKSNQEPKPLKSYPEWKSILAGFEGLPEWQSRAEEWSQFMLRPSIRHGDLTRPNLRRSPSGALWVHDWERGSFDGVPGLDLVHFLIQDVSFRNLISPQKVIQHVLKQLNAEPCRQWIQAIGWKDGPVPLLASTIAFNIGSEYFKQVELLDILKQLDVPLKP
jgi:hypothetical protein